MDFRASTGRLVTTLTDEPGINLDLDIQHLPGKDIPPTISNHPTHYIPIHSSSEEESEGAPA